MWKKIVFMLDIFFQKDYNKRWCESTDSSSQVGVYYEKFK